MKEAMNLFTLLVWGGVLGLIYQIISHGVRKHYKYSWILWGIGGVVVFCSTAVFLFYLNRGNVGLYGFPIMILGFFLYLHYIQRSVSRVLHPLYSLLSHVGIGLKNVVGFIMQIVICPLGCLVRMMECIVAIVMKPFMVISKKRENRQCRKKEKSREDVEVDTEY